MLSLESEALTCPEASQYLQALIQLLSAALGIVIFAKGYKIERLIT
jgi:hypothetical protein